MKKQIQKKGIRSSLKTKLITMSCLLLVIPLLAAGLISYGIAKSELNKKGEVILKNSVVQAMQLIDAKAEQVKLGLIDLETAQEQVKTYLLGPMNSEGKRPINRNIDLGQNGYFIIYDEHGLEVAHPTLEGDNVWEAEDKSGNGFKLVQEQIKIARNGGGYVYYAWTLPDSEQIGEKISYQEQDPHWGWIVSAGSYMSDYNQGSNAILKAILLIIVGAILLGVIAIILFAKHLTDPIHKISKGLGEVAQGNLIIEPLVVKNNDETGRLAESFNEMLDNMKKLISTARDSSSTVMKFSDSLATITEETSRAINEVSYTIQEVAQAVGEEARGTENAVSKMDQLSASIENVNNAAVHMNDVVTETGSYSTKGLEKVSTLIHKKDDSNRATEEINEAILKVNDSTGKIHVITDAITQISQQTNLLALNASIEAARAGEAGKGFAVVAEEIRKLAEQSANAVSEINSIIEEIDQYSNSSVKTMELVRAASREQNNAVDETRNVFEEISNAIEELIMVVNEINRESNTMKQMKDDIVVIMQEISASTQQTSAATEEVSASSEEQLAAVEEVSHHAQQLKSLSIELEDVIEQFKL